MTSFDRPGCQETLATSFKFFCWSMCEEQINSLMASGFHIELKDRMGRFIPKNTNKLQRSSQIAEVTNNLMGTQITFNGQEVLNRQKRLVCEVQKVPAAVNN